jgi:serine/threonine-protein kinase
MGTPQYMSPEQCRGLAEHIDQRTDIYTLGVIAYEMVCGSPPFVSEGLGDMLVMHLSNPPAPPRTLNPAVPEVLEAAIMRALAKDPSQRFASMAEFQEALRPGNRASAGTATQRAAGQSSVWETAARTSSAPAVSGSTALGTTLASSAGQFLPGHTESTRRRTHGARRAVLAGGVLLMAALGIYATVEFRGRLTTSAAAPDRGAGARSTTPLLPILAPPDAARALVAPSDAAPLPEAAHVTAVVAEEARPGKPQDKRPDKKGTKKHLARSTPLPQELPPSLPRESPLPLPKELPPPAPKKVERW